MMLQTVTMHAPRQTSCRSACIRCHAISNGQTPPAVGSQRRPCRLSMQTLPGKHLFLQLLQRQQRQA
jgi:hypothetical protein